MAELKVVVFNVDFGLCVYVKTPNKYGMMIDCGRGKSFSPVKWIAINEASDLETWDGHRLTRLIVTHPHDDHVEDIDNLKAILPPAFLRRHKNYEWEPILNPPKSDNECSDNVRTYYYWQLVYRPTQTAKPDLGLQLDTFCLTPSESRSINPDIQHSLNNSSYVTVLTYQPTDINRKWKVVVSGDNETACWEELLKREKFCSSIRGADFFITPHHGHQSGFCQDIFKVMGKPLLNISSLRAKDESAYDGYTNLAENGEFNGEKASHITTRKYGHIELFINETGYEARALKIKEPDLYE